MLADRLPTGVVTLLVADVGPAPAPSAGEAGPSGSAAPLAIVREIVARRGAWLVDRGERGPAVAAFARASDAVAAGLEARRRLAGARGPRSTPPPVRIALHTEEAESGDGAGYTTATLLRARQLLAGAPLGQVILSPATTALVRDRLPAGAALVELDGAAAGAGRSGHASLLTDAEAAGGVATAVPRRSEATPTPTWPSPLIGRERERREVARLLSVTGLLTITGAGGSGKTRLAASVVDEVGATWSDGVAWVDLARVAAGAPAAGAVAAALGLAERPGADAQSLVVHFLAGSRLLLVLDNCEHVLAGCAEIADRVRRVAPDVAILATSREPLGAAGEVTWRIPSLALPPDAERDAATIAAYDAVRLFLARAREARPDLELEAGALPAVATLCRRLDGIPLALELAAARLRTLSLARLAAALDDRFRVLAGGQRGAMPRQRTLRASVEWSHDLLTEAEQVLFRRLGVFAAPFTLEAAEAVAADEDVDRLEVHDLLARLLDKSLVQPAGARYRLLETLRQFALERADAAGELPALRARHLEWFRRRAARWRLDREVPSDEIVAEIAPDAPDLLAALDTADASDRPAPVEVLYALAAQWRPRYASAEVRAAWAKVSRHLAPGSDAWLEALAPLAVDLALAADLGWLAAAREALDARGDALDPQVRGFVETGASFGFAYTGFAEGLAGLRRAMEDGRRSGSLALEVEAGIMLAAVFMSLGDRARCRPLLAWLDRHLPGEAWARSPHRVTTAMVALYGADFETARRILEPELERCRDPFSVSNAAVLGFCTKDRGLLERAIAAGERLLPPTAIGGDGAWMRAMLLRVDGDLAGSGRELESALAAGVLPNVQAMLQFSLAETRFSSGDDDAAAAILDSLEAQIAPTMLHYARIQVLLLRAHLLRRRREPAAAEQRAHEAIALARELELCLPMVEGLEVLALVAGDGARGAEAARLLGAADGFRRSTGARMRLFERDDQLSALREHLEAEHLAAGERLSLVDAVDYARRGRGERGRPVAGWESLTPTESRVADLVAQGLPNREIAAALFVSVSTVKTHLLHVFGKLEVRTRAELAARIARRHA